jgi:hypothetical protein
MTDNSKEAPQDLGAPASYLVLADGTPVWNRSGDAVGTVENVLADDAQDIFHGLILDTAAGRRFAASDQVDGIFERGVIVARPAAKLPELNADAAAQAADDDTPGGDLRRAWDWLIRPQ